MEYYTTDLNYTVMAVLTRSDNSYIATECGENGEWSGQNGEWSGMETNSTMPTIAIANVPLHNSKFLT